jgi:O-antigen/teichoic acid export membrane protein
VLARLIDRHGALIRAYAATLGGSVGRLVISLLYFVSLANSLSLSAFGLFATASAVGVVLSRVISFGFVSPLYRVAAVKPRLLGVYYAGFLASALISLPLFTALAFGVFYGFFEGQISLSAFALIVGAEALLWRSLEVVVIINNGLNKYGRASALVVIGTLFRALAALAFALSASHQITNWAWYYLGANSLALAVALIFFLPRKKIRFCPRLYPRRMSDSISTAGAEILFYMQMELDKLVVLAIAGAEVSGIYAIVMRLADLTAVPVRSFNMLLVQRLMRVPETLKSLAARAGIEALIFAISVAGFAFIATVLWIYPSALGRNVSVISGVLALALVVPGFRNITEYHAEILYARGQTGIRMINLALLAALKAVLLGFVLTEASNTETWLWALNPAFAALWLSSALLTYSALRRPAKRV